MKKKIAVLMLAFALLAGLAACREKTPAAYHGLNARILEMTYEPFGMVVTGLDEGSVLGEACYLDCSGEDISFLYVNNETEEVVGLMFGNFKVGDMITVDVPSVQDGYAEPTRIQLLNE